MRVVAVYRDSASGTSTKHRKAFLEMVETITRGAPFAAVLVRDVSRFGRFYDMDEAAFYEVLFLGHHVKTIYCEEVFTDDTTPMASLIKSVRRVMAAEYSRDRARLVRYGQARATRLGFHVAGPPPYGLRRVMVTSAGEAVRDLGPGDWKALSSHRTTLAPGRPDDVATVRRIFAEYAGGRRTVEEIVQRLNADHLPSPHGRRWNGPTVGAILRNPRYTGIAQYRTATPAGPEGASAVVVQGQFAAARIIEQETWVRVQDRAASMVRRWSNDALADHLRMAYERHGCVEERMLGSLPHRCCWETVNNRFSGGADEALALSYASQIDEARGTLTRLLQSSFDTAADSEGWAIQGGPTISFRPAFLHRYRRGSITWLIQATGLERDLVLASGIGSDGKRASDFFLARRTQVRAGVSGLRGMTRHAIAGSQLAGRLSRLRCAPLLGVERAFLAVVRSHDSVNLTRIARHLGWSAWVVGAMYRRLAARAERLPPLRTQPVKWVEVVCGKCGKRRWKTPEQSQAQKSDQCRLCAARRPVRKVLVRCPRCGLERFCWPSAVAKLSAGAQTPCRRCHLREAARQERPSEAQKRGR
jgi:Site-specific recombinases, DNA invertase Pin homologs